MQDASLAQTDMYFACDRCKWIFSSIHQLSEHQKKSRHRGILQFRID